jgi:hypothetical protein
VINPVADDIPQIGAKYSPVGAPNDPAGTNAEGYDGPNACDPSSRRRSIRPKDIEKRVAPKIERKRAKWSRWELRRLEAQIQCELERPGTARAMNQRGG